MDSPLGLAALSRDAAAAEAGTPAPGAGVIAHENARLWLGADVESEWASRVYRRLPKTSHPTETVHSKGQIEFVGARIEYAHLGQAHTDGDL